MIIWLGILFYVVPMLTGIYITIGRCFSLGQVHVGDIALGLMCFVPAVNLLLMAFEFGDTLLWEKMNEQVEEES